MTQELTGFAVQPKLDCPHLDQEKVKSLIEFLLVNNMKHFSEFICFDCKDNQQNWICLECQIIGCSRYVKGHMSEHNTTSKHPITLSFSDASFWCYDCESYIDANCLKVARVQLSKSKFAGDKQKLKQQADNITQQLQKLCINQEEKQAGFTYEKLITGLKNNQYKKIVFLVGAGLSVASGIPDFRSPKTGLYSQLKKYNLPFPEAVFELNFYKKNPQPFLRVAKQYLNGQYEPTLGHRFMKKLQDLDILEMILTQNIDDLQYKAGVKEDKLLQAHGHGRTAHCIKCKEQASIELWKEHLEKLQPMKCAKCSSLVKPDIVFFGQQLPKKFNQAPEIVERADLVFIVGTSLAVVPFSYLGTMIKKDCPVVLVNNEDSIAYRNDKLWLKGDIQQNFQKIMKQIYWI